MQAALLWAAGLVLLTAGYYKFMRRVGASSSLSHLKHFTVGEVLNCRENTMILLGHFHGGPLKNSEGEEALVIIHQVPFVSDSIGKIGEIKMTQTHHNDIYRTLMGVSNRSSDIKISVISPCTAKHKKKFASQARYFLRETKQLYDRYTLPYIEAQDVSKINWVYNILDGQAEVEDMIVDETGDATGFVLLPDTKWPKPHMGDNLYCLAMCRRRDIRSLRDLTPEHLPLLRNIRDKSLAEIERRWGVLPCQLRAFVHYLPSYFHFHVHFTHWTCQTGVQTERAVLLEDLILRLECEEKTSVNMAPSWFNAAGVRDGALTMLLGEVEHEPLVEALRADGLLPPRSS